jgi:hypothetical protein
MIKAVYTKHNYIYAVYYGCKNLIHYHKGPTKIANTWGQGAE